MQAYRYQRDFRASAKGSETIIDRELSLSYDVINRNSNAWIVTSHDTIRARHGPGSLKTWRLAQGTYPNLATELYHEYNNGWPAGLQAAFENVVLDEAQALKNTDTDIAATIDFLQARFHICLTVTPLLAGARDCKGLHKAH